MHMRQKKNSFVKQHMQACRRDVTRAGQHMALDHLNIFSNTTEQAQHKWSTEHNMVTLLAQKMSINYNSSLLRERTVNQSLVVFHQVQQCLLPWHSTVLVGSLLFINNGLLVNLITAPPSPVLYDIHVYTRAALSRIRNELCGPPVGWSWPALTYIPRLSRQRATIVIVCRFAGRTTGQNDSNWYS